MQKRGGGVGLITVFSLEKGGGVIERGSLIKDVREIQPFHLEISINSFPNPQPPPPPQQLATPLTENEVAISYWGNITLHLTLLAYSKCGQH